MKIEINTSPQDWFVAIQNKIKQAQQKTALKVNSNLLQLYFDIGTSILEVQKRLAWGSQIIDQLSKSINQSFPSSTGFSVRNLKYMRAFAKAYPNFPIVQVPLAQTENEFVQVSLAQITWYHHISLLTKVKNIKERIFYIEETAKNKWSRDTMLLQIKSNLYTRQGKAITNFSNTLAKPQSDLAKQIIKDPYVFDFTQVVFA